MWDAGEVEDKSYKVLAPNGTYSHIYQECDSNSCLEISMKDAASGHLKLALKRQHVALSASLLGPYKFVLQASCASPIQALQE